MDASNHTCPPQPSLTETAQQNLFGGISFHYFAIAVAGGCSGISCTIVLTLMAQHASHYSKPREQQKIMKICLLIPLYSIFSFLSICFPGIYVYLNVWFSYFEAVALATVFLLMCEFISDTQSERELFFSALQIRDRKGHVTAGYDNVAWFRKRWFLVFQYPVVALGVAIATMVTQSLGVYCLDSTGTQPYWFAQFWLNIISNIGITMALFAIVKFYGVLKPYIANHRPLAKLIAFKIVVALTFIEAVIFWILQDTHTSKPTATLTYADITVGIPSLIICMQNVPLAISFHYAYTCTPYVIPEQSVLEHPKYKGGFWGWKAWLATFNPAEVFRGVVFTFKMASLMPKQDNVALVSNSSREFHPLRQDEDIAP